MDTMGIIFSNIYDSMMGALTEVRTSASIPVGGRYRQIDFILSSMSGSGIRHIGIITKYNYQSLMDHLGSCQEWDLQLNTHGVVFVPALCHRPHRHLSRQARSPPHRPARPRERQPGLCGPGRQQHHVRHRLHQGP